MHQFTFVLTISLQIAYYFFKIIGAELKKTPRSISDILHFSWQMQVNPYIESLKKCNSKSAIEELKTSIMCRTMFSARQKAFINLLHDIMCQNITHELQRDLNSLFLSENEVVALSLILSQQQSITQLTLSSLQQGQSATNTHSYDVFNLNQKMDVKLHTKNTTLNHLYIYCSAKSAIHILGHNTSITQLHLTHMHIQHTFATSLAQFKALTQLHISYACIESHAMHALTHHPTITYLSLLNCNINHEHVLHLVHNTSIRHIDLTNNNVGDIGAIALAQNRYATTLSLQNNNITDAGAIALANNSILQTLNLLDNNISTVGARSLATNMSIKHLNLSNNNVSDAGAQALASNHTVQSLNLCNNNIGLDGAKALAANTSLKTLNLSHNNIGAAGVNEFKHNITISTLRLVSCANYDALNSLQYLQMSASMCYAFYLFASAASNVHIKRTGPDASKQIYITDHNQKILPRIPAELIKRIADYIQMQNDKTVDLPKLIKRKLILH